MSVWQQMEDWWNENFSFSRETDDEMMRLLSKLEIFEGLKISDCRLISTLLHERQYNKNEVIFSEGDPASALFLIQEGEVKVSKAERTADEGKLNTLTANSSLGELALCFEHKRTGTARAQTPATIQVLFRQEFLKFSERHPRCALNVMFNLSRRVGNWLHETNEKNLELRQQLREIREQDGKDGE